MSVKVHEAYSLDSMQHRLLWWDDFLGDQVQDEWHSTGSGGGSTVVVDAQTGGIIRITCGATNGFNWRVLWNDIRSLLVTKKVSMEIRAKLTQINAVQINLQLLFDANNRILFYYDSATNANWQIVTRDGGISTSSNSGIATDTDYHIFRIECFPTGQVHFYIDGVETTNSPSTTNIPDDATDYLQPYLQIITLEDVAKSMDIDYVVVRQEV